MAAETGWADSPPSSVLPVTVAGGLVLIREAGVLAYLGPVCAYPAGFTFQLTISVNPDLASDRVINVGGHAREEHALRPRLQVRSGGELADSRPTGLAAAGQLVLRDCGGRTWWVSPLPRGGRVEFALFLLGAPEPSGTAQLDAEPIIAAARQSVVLWAQPGTGPG
jgi:hypothetical protein